MEKLLTKNKGTINTRQRYKTGKDSPNIAKNCLIIGIVMFVIEILIYISFIAIIGSMMGTNL